MPPTGRRVLHSPVPADGCWTSRSTIGARRYARGSSRPCRGTGARGRYAVACSRRVAVWSDDGPQRRGLGADADERVLDAENLAWAGDRSKASDDRRSNSAGFVVWDSPSPLPHVRRTARRAWLKPFSETQPSRSGLKSNASTVPSPCVRIRGRGRPEFPDLSFRLASERTEVRVRMIPPRPDRQTPGRASSPLDPPSSGDAADDDDRVAG